MADAIIWYSPQILTVSMYLLAALGLYALIKITLKGKA